MSSKKITIIDAHPDPGEERYCRALVRAYVSGAEAGGHQIRRITLAYLEFPLVRTQEDWEKGVIPPAIREAQEAIGWAGHLVIVYPLWLGSTPALLKGFLEQALRPGFALKQGKLGFAGLLKGRSARIVVTMAMPALVYRLYFFSHGLAVLRRNILRFVGIGPIGTTLIGGIASIDAVGRQKWLSRIEKLGREGK